MITLRTAPHRVPTASGTWDADGVCVHWRLGSTDEDASATARSWIEELVRDEAIFPWRGFAATPAWRKPAVSEADGASVSISHSRGVVLVGVALGATVGVDVETAPFTAFGSPALQRRMGAPSDDGSDPDGFHRALAGVWTAKEALAKASGHGLALDLRSLSIDPTPDHTDSPAVAHLAILGLSGPLVSRLRIHDGSVTPLSGVRPRSFPPTLLRSV